MSTPAHLALSTKIATDGTVLLKNSGSLLPLTRRARSIAVIGDAASEHPQTAAGGSATVLPSRPVVTPLAGITARAGSGVNVTHAQGTLGVATDALPAVPANAFGSGLSAAYYASADLSGSPFATGTVPNLDITGNPAGRRRASRLVGPLFGTLTAPATGDYRFDLSAGGYVHVWIDGTQVVSFTPIPSPCRRADPPHRRRALDPRRGSRRSRPPWSRSTRSPSRPGCTCGWQPQENLMIDQAAGGTRRATSPSSWCRSRRPREWTAATLALPADQDKLIAAVAARQPAHRGRPEHLQRGDDAMAQLGRRRGRGVVPRPDVRHGAGAGALRRRQPLRQAAGDLPRERRADARARTRSSTPGDGDDVYYSEGLLVGYRWYDATGRSPLFPFGYGLSYTSFRMSGLSVARAAARSGRPSP